jgi:E3 ubiquitin-protein ligase DOA10
MICRICLDDGTPSTLVSPCRCIGTAQYIHRECLERYFTHYPDRMCRVCRTEMVGPMPYQDKVLTAIVLVGLGVTLTGSTLSFASKGTLGMLLLATTAFFLRNNLFNQSVAIGTLIVYVTFVNGGQAHAVVTIISTVNALAALVTMLNYIPAAYVATMAVTMLVFVYLWLTALAFAATTDSYALSVFMCIVYMGWYAWVRTHPRFPIE